MRLVIFICCLFGSITGNQNAMDMLNRLFTRDSLDCYEIRFDINHTLPSVKSTVGRSAEVEITVPLDGSIILAISGTSVSDAAYCIHQFCIDHMISFSWHDTDKKIFPGSTQVTGEILII